MEATVTVSAKLGNFTFDGQVQIGSEMVMKETIFDEMRAENHEIDESENELSAEDVIFDIVDWEDLDNYTNLQDFDTMEDLADYSGDYENDLNIISAGVACGVPIKDIDESYIGQFSSDEDFAEDMAEQLGVLTKETTWPLYCIDWIHAARELMMDYSEQDGYYFRNL